MCGIAGFFSPSNRLSESNLRAMTDALRHRGPDASGFYLSNDKTVGLGHRRLSIIDLSTSANQPIHSQCGRYVIAFNGEIYNYKEIAAELRVKLKTNSDTEVLVEAFAQWGEIFVHRLNGMFAFAIYDKTENRLFIYKDRIGIKPLFYFSSGNEFYFTSELKSFYALKGFELGEISKSAVQNFFYLGYIPTPHTIYSNIKKLEAGSFVVIDKTGTQVKKYWKLEEQIEAQTINDFSSAKSKLKDLLHSAVSYRMISDVPFGTFLSGGIDSSLVTAIAQQHSSVPINTFSIGFKEQNFNEIEYARKVAKHLGTNHHEMICSYNVALEMFEDIFSVYDEPFADTSMFPTMLVSKFARQNVTMILSGDGGDETYFGYGFYNWGNRLNLPGVHAFRNLISTALEASPSPRFNRVANLFNYPKKEKLKSHIFSQEQYCFTENQLNELLAQPNSRVVDLDEAIDVTARKLSFNEQQAIFDLKYYMHDDLLVKVDRASMQYALEVRVPLLDYRLVNFALNLNPSLRKKGGVAKFLLKEVLYDMVPREYFERPKWGFGMPVGKWLKKEWHHLIEEHLSEAKIKESGFFNYGYVKKLVQRFEQGEDYLYYRIWLLILFQHWYSFQQKNREING